MNTILFVCFCESTHLGLTDPHGGNHKVTLFLSKLNISIVPVLFSFVSSND